jgi:hypothetical protein
MDFTELILLDKAFKNQLKIRTIFQQEEKGKD